MADLRCPEKGCGSKNVIKYGKKYRRDKTDRRKVAVLQRFLCKTCGRTTVRPLRRG